MEQFASEYGDKIEIIGVGAQDSIELAEEFKLSVGIESFDLLWDPSFQTWSDFGVTVNSQAVFLYPNGVQASDVFLGFDDERMLSFASGLS